MGIAKKLRLTPLALDIQENVVYKLMHSQSKLLGEAIIVADIGNTHMHTYLIKNGVRTFTKRMMINTDQYERTLVSLGRLDTLDAGFKEMDVSPSGLEKDALIENTMNQYLYSIVEQLQRVQQFNMSYGPKEDMIPIHKIYIGGGVANLLGIITYLETMIDTPIEKISSYLPPVFDNEKDMALYMNCLGVLIREKE